MNLSEGIKVDPLYLYASFLSYFACYVYSRKGDTLTSDSLYCYTALKILSASDSTRKSFMEQKSAQKIASNWCECVIKKEKRKTRNSRNVLKKKDENSSLFVNIKY